MTVDQRAIVDFGLGFDPCLCSSPCPPPDPLAPLTAWPVWEPAIGVLDSDHRMAVTISGRPALATSPSSPVFPWEACAYPGLLAGLRAAQSTVQSSTWRAEYIFGTQTPGRGDPSIVGDRARGRYLIAALGPEAITLTFHPDPASGGGFAPWQTIATPQYQHVDKPWMFRGSTEDEFYIVYMDSPNYTNIRYACLRSEDGGFTWEGGEITVPSADGQTTETIIGRFCAQASRTETGVCAAFRVASNVRVLTGIDDPDGGVDFTLARDSVGVPLDLALQGVESLALPVPGGIKAKSHVPWIVSRTSDVSRLEVIVHDRAGTSDPVDPDDMNILCFRLLRTGAAWSLEQTTLVNTENYLVGSTRPDDFVPAVEVDRFGFIHAAFYSNKAASFGGIPCGPGIPGDKYDVYYALSTDGGVTLTNFNLRTSCAQDRALDVAQFPLDYALGEYIGIAVDDSDESKRIVWIAYPGTSTTDPSTDQTVLFVSKVVVKP